MSGQAITPEARSRWIARSIGAVLSSFVGTASAVATTPMKLGPTWYPVIVALTALPCAWLGGVLHLRQAAR